MINYKIQEGEFLAPDKGWLDTSMNIFQNPVTRSSFIISRGKINNGNSLEEEMTQQWAILQPTLQNLMYEVVPCAVLPASPDCAVQETHSTFIRSGVQHHQRQLALHQQENSQLLVFTYTTMATFSTEDDHIWSSIKNSLRLD